MRVLVTGGDSFIGSHLVSKLCSRGEDVTALVLDNNKAPVAHDGKLRTYYGDITEKESLKELRGPFDVVFHLAGYVHRSAKTNKEISQLFQVNVHGTRNLLDTVGKYTRHLVMSSSVSVYGVEKGLLLDETTDAQPITPYGKSKLKAEELLAKWAHNYGAIATNLRLPLVYGPGNKGNIFKMINAVDRGYFVLIGRGLNKRSIVYVGNVVDAAIAVATSKQNGVNTYIVKDQKDYTVRELYAAIANGLGKNPRFFYIPENMARIIALTGDFGGRLTGKMLPFNSDVMGKLTNTLTFSCQKLQNDTGFKPMYDLNQTIDETISWYRTFAVTKKHD